MVLTLSLAFLGFVVTLDPSYYGGFDPSNPSSSIPWGSCVVLGQPCLLAIWAAFRRQPLATRLPRTLGLSALLGLLLAWSQRHLPESSFRSGLFVCLVMVGVFLSYTLLLALVRWRYGWRIDDHSEPLGVTESANQFSLRQLLIWTAGVAAALAMARWLGEEEATWRDVRDMVVALSLLGIPCLLWLVPSVGYALSRTSQRRFAVWAHLMALLGVAIQYLAILASDSLGTSFDLSLAKILLLDLGYAATIAAGLGILRVCGYRLTRGTTAAAAEGEIPEGLIAIAPPRWWRSPFPYVVGVLLLLILALAWPAWRIEQGKRAARAEWAAAEPFRCLGVSASFEKGRLCVVRFSRSQPVTEAALHLLSQYGNSSTRVYLVLPDNGMTGGLRSSLVDLQGEVSLDLSNTATTDAELAQLKDLKNLSRLDVRNTQVTPEGIAAFLREHSNCMVESSPGPTVSQSSPNP